MVRINGLLASCVVLALVVGLRATRLGAQDLDCDADTVLGFSLRTPGFVDAGDFDVLELAVAPDAPLELESIAFLENLSGEPQRVYFCSGTFSLAVAHDPVALELTGVTIDDTDYGEASFPGLSLVRRAESVLGSGFVVADPLCFASIGPLALDERLSLVRARYSLVAPHGAARVGETIVTRLRFTDLSIGEGFPDVHNTISIDGRGEFACTRDLEIRIRVVAESEFVRGDANLDSRIDVSDAVTVLRTLFQWPDAPVRCADAADANDDGFTDVSDAVFIFDYLFRGGRVPPAPFPEAGSDPTDDPLRCVDSRR